MFFNQLKRNIQFSCIKNKKLIETMADDESSYKGKKMSDYKILNYYRMEMMSDVF